VVAEVERLLHVDDVRAALRVARAEVVQQLDLESRQGAVREPSESRQRAVRAEAVQQLHLNQRLLVEAFLVPDDLERQERVGLGRQPRSQKPSV
jgi:hypothetical protein